MWGRGLLEQSGPDLEGVGLDKEDRDGLHCVHDDARVMGCRLPRPGMSIANLVLERRKTIHRLHQATNDVLKAIVELGPLIVESERLRDSLVLLWELPLVVVPYPDQPQLEFAEDRLEEGSGSKRASPNLLVGG